MSFWTDPLSTLALLVAMLWPGALSAQPDAAKEEKPLREVYQDFRGSRPMPEWMKLHGPDVDTVANPEEKGFRIVLPATREKNWPIEATTTFTVSGDFEITGTYELLSASKPTQGYGVGVSLNIATNDARDKFAKVGRAMRPKEGSVYVTEYWNREPPKDYKVSSVGTEAKAGQLRLMRDGAILHFLVADGPGGEFREIKRREFGIEDIAHVRFVVADSGHPGNSVDARLVDLKIRARRMNPDPSTDPAPAPAPASAAVPPEADREPASYIWLVVAIGLAAVLLIAASVGVLFLLLRRRRVEAAPPRATVEAPADPAPAMSAMIAFACPGCGKNLKVKAQLAGKKVKCPGCGKPAAAPSLPTSD
jgi:hypothetical protein